MLFHPTLKGQRKGRHHTHGLYRRGQGSHLRPQRSYHLGQGLMTHWKLDMFVALGIAALDTKFPIAG